MVWYSDGTITVTNGSTAVTGSGTSWVGAIKAGQAMIMPNGLPYELASVSSDTSATLAKAYEGSSQSGQAYSVMPTEGPTVALLTSLNALLTNYQSVYDGIGQGKFPDGTAVAPSMSFAADPDTGFHRPADNQIGMVAGGVLRALLSSAAFNVDVPITGTAVQASAGDATSGRLLKVGAFGLGGAAVTTGSGDLATLALPTGTYKYLASIVTGGPETSAWQHTLQVWYNAETDRRHFLSARSVDAAGNRRVWFGWNSGTAAITWMPVPVGDFMVGTAAHSGGVPTGAIIEVGSNANGEYVRFAGGLQICWKKVTLTGQALTDAYAGMYRSASLLAGNTVFAATFVSPPACEITTHVQDATSFQVVGGIGDVNNTPASIYAVTTSSLTDRTIHVNVVATGLWHN